MEEPGGINNINKNVVVSDQGINIRSILSETNSESDRDQQSGFSSMNLEI